MKIKWLGHASFLVTSEKGVKIITDPYTVGGGLSYGQISEAADVVTVSHDHADHNNARAVVGSPEIVKGPGPKKAKGLDFLGVPTHHDETGGKERGENTVFAFTVDGLRVCHLGDLGRDLTLQEASQLGKVDMLFTPVGGFYTIDAKVATQVQQKLSPRVTIPMHYKTSKCGYPIAGVEAFLQGKTGVRQLKGSEVEIKALPASPEIVVLEPALG